MGSSNKKIVLVAAAPVASELEEKKFQVSSAGKILLSCLASAELNLKAMHCTYVVPCQAPDDKTNTDEFTDALGFCANGLTKDLERYALLGAKVIVAIGPIATAALGIEGNILKIRGSVYEKTISGKRLFVIPVVDPNYIMRGNMDEYLTMVTDFAKAGRISRDSWEPPKENFVTHPTIEWLEAKLKKLMAMKVRPLLACDTEGWIGGWKKHWMTGFAISSTEAFCIPWRKQGGGLYWKTMEEQQRAQAVLKSFCTEFPLMFQNAQFDVMVLHELGIDVPAKNIAHDTMLMHHMFHPELRHTLGYIASIYADTPYWKDIVLASETAFNAHDDKDFRTYNMRDCVVLHQIFPLLRDDLVEAGLYDHYQNVAIKLVHPTVQMQINGMRLLAARLPEWQKTIDSNHCETLSSLKRHINAPESFSPSSPYHVRWLFFGVKPASFEKSVAELATYDVAGCKKKRTTAAYQKLLSATETVKRVKPLVRVTGNLKTTDTGALSTDKQALNKMRLAAMREIERLENLKRPTMVHRTRILDLARIIGTVDRLLAWSRWQKLKTTYYSFSAADDGRIHPSYPIHRTRTGRLASKSPNWQNLPGDVTTLFGPAKGNCLIKPDWSNIEMRVLSFASDDKVLQEQFASGKKIHDENTKILFGIDRSDPRFDTYKRAAKTYVFGRGYGGGLYGIFERVSMQVPEAKLSFDVFKKADDNYRKAHPAYVTWSNNLIRQAVESRTCVNAFGRRRIFLGDEGAIKREILNTPIQGTAADIANYCLIQLQEWIDSHKTSAKLVTQIHDAIMIECKLDEADRIRDIMKQIMEQPFTIWGYTTSFPIDIDVCGGDYPLQETAEDGTIRNFTSSSWGEMVKWKEWEDARTVSETGKRRRSNIKAERSTAWLADWGLGDDDDDSEAAARAGR